ncbi:uncharacterized protein DFL_006434 [Arthrobotrys flagrans]|uniref:Uncharacterized protein n=1 Tax=Arthrobotrys flagrans TaxID=97331 RepID=A0A437A122_ARTFL|nr:hypothetical protein DFL_006434 [Arthrobotrys flagrans]
MWKYEFYSFLLTAIFVAQSKALPSSPPLTSSGSHEDAGNITVYERVINPSFFYEGSFRIVCASVGEVMNSVLSIDPGEDPEIRRAHRLVFSSAGCQCHVRLGQPHLDENIPLADYDDAVNRIPSAIRGHPENSRWRWNPNMSHNPFVDIDPAENIEYVFMPPMESRPIEDDFSNPYDQELNMNGPEAFWEPVLRAEQLRNRRTDWQWRNYFQGDGPYDGKYRGDQGPGGLRKRGDGYVEHTDTQENKSVGEEEIDIKLDGVEH